MQRLVSLWKKRFTYIIAVDRVLHLDDFQSRRWGLDPVELLINLANYKNAQPDPLREFAENLLAEINTNNMKDITRFCNVFVDLNFQDSEAKMIWVDRLGLDMRVFSPNYERNFHPQYFEKVTELKHIKS
ncbi:proton gradient regulation protein [Medicago truncatula]|uniref:Proton gradient regulation protein n=1 Tax=Medicago truncatula TaxID=3880 RepID=A0A072USJ5_MEDTR|nr:proton gradient regulation protein [Medicago truncatula]